MDYQCRFGHTSAACPIVAGVASLLIARDSTLTSKEIDSVLRYSAKTELDWGGSITPPDTLYGFGIVDAYRAMLAITRGDANNDGFVNVGDGVYIVTYYEGGPEPMPDILTGDANCDGEVGLADVIYIVNYIFKGGPEPEICFKY